MSACSGLHCAGCAGGAAIPIVPLFELCGAVWVAEHLVEVLVVAAVCGLLGLAVVVMLMRWADRRDGRHAELWRTNQAAALPPRVVVASVTATTERPALERPAVHLHFHGTPDAGQAEVIRRALGAD